jgi:rsbT co-antagonist protein RsbR
VTTQSKLPGLVVASAEKLLEHWLREQLGATTLRRDLLSDAQLRQESKRFLDAFREALSADDSGNIDERAWAEPRLILEEMSASRAGAGFTPKETATFVFSLKQPLFELLRAGCGSDADLLFGEVWRATVLLDKLGLYTASAFQKSREALIRRQQREMLELSTPVIKIWDGVLAIPMIGTLDSERSQIVMESLLQQITETGAQIAIIDITGVPAVDTMTAQHLLKTIAAARLMGAECIISGIRPQIAQTIVHLGIELNQVQTKATLAGAFAVALKIRGLGVQARREPRAGVEA